MITIRDVKNPSAIIQYCRANIGPQRFHLHNAVGGVGWRLYTTTTDRTWSIDVEDELQATRIALQYSE